MRGAKRSLIGPLIGLVTSVGLLVAGCSSAEAGHGTVAAGPSDARSAPEPSAPPSSSTLSSPALPVSSTASSRPALPSPPASVGRATEARKLVGLLEPKPAGATTWSQLWGHILTPTLGQFVRREYAPSAVNFAESQLKGQGLLAIAHRTWIARDGNQADVVLLGFKTASGATSRWLSATQAKSEATGVRPLRIAGAGTAVQAFYTPQLDDLGYVRTIVYAHRGNIVSETFTYTPARLKKADIVTWSRAQLNRLP